MLLLNNLEIQTDEIEDKIKHVLVHRLRKKPLLSKSVVATIVPVIPQVAEPKGARALIKKMPIVGPLAISVYRFVRQLGMPGITWKQRIRLIPGLGSFALWCYSLLRLNAVRAQIAQELAELRQLQAVNHLESKNRLTRFDAIDIERRLNMFDSLDLANRLNQFDKLDLENRLRHFDKLDLENRLRHFDKLDLENRLRHFDKLDLENRLRYFDMLDLENRLRYFDTLDLEERVNRSEAFLQKIDAAMCASDELSQERDNRIAGLALELRRKIHQVASPTSDPEKRLMTTTAMPLESNPSDIDLTSFYVEFEGMFRGSTAIIKKRLAAAYTSYLDDFAGDPDARVVDLGCGRGEWLELLNEKGITCIGVDLNSAMVDVCRERGFTAECADAIAYLQALPENSLTAVTGFHIIEHLPFEALIELFDAALHALRPGGVAIFETPNPENLTVGACNFYYDPTHKHPIVPVVADFMVRQRGFSRAEILRLHPYPADHQLKDDSEIARRINNALYGPQDYAVIGWKPHAN